MKIWDGKSNFPKTSASLVLTRIYRVQNQIRDMVIHEDRNLSFTIIDDGILGLRRVGGVDISFVPQSNLAYVAITVLSFPELELVHLECDTVEIDVPYIPGYLAFRELPAIKMIAKDLIKKVKPEDFPQVFLVDGNGQLHPRGAGIASHLGVVMDWPTIGCGKTFFRMDGLTSKIIDETIAKDLQSRRGKQPTEPIVGKSGKTHGVALLNGGKNVANPIFISVGHRVSLESAVHIVKACSKHRVPEPIRMADLLSRQQAQQHVTRPKMA